MLRFYYNPRYKYTNREIINLLGDNNFVEKDYQNIDSPDTINGHIIYKLSRGESIPSYIFDTENNRRYFVSGITQLRSGKFQISLLRDIISESPSTWKQEEAYISAGTASNYNKYKRWGLPYTNTKIKESRLDFGGKSSFFVFYVNTQNFSQEGVLTESDLKISSTTVPGISGYDLEIPGIQGLSHYEYLNAGKVSIFNTANFFLGIQSGSDNSNFNLLYKKVRNEASTIAETTIGPSGYMYLKTKKSAIINNESNCLTNLRYTIDNFFENNYRNQVTTNSPISQTAINFLSSLEGKIIYDSIALKYYKINVSRETFNYDRKNLNYNDAQVLLNNVKNISFPDYGGSGTNFQILPSNGSPWVQFAGYENVYEFTLEELGNVTTFDFNFKANVQKLPKSAVRCVNIVLNGALDYPSKDDIAQALMLAQTNGINENNDTGRILDIQFLPFSVADIRTDNSLDFKLNGEALITRFLDVDDFVFDIDMQNIENINKECDTIKIVSPSRANQYLFRPYDNDGNMKFSVKATIKPFSSTIYVRPSTEGLLVRDFDDKDCLIINEDFSLTNVSSAWTNYIYNNRNYQNAFEREIQGREFERSWERRIEQAQMKSDEWTARNISADKSRTYTANLPLISDIAGAIGTAFQDQTYMQMAQLDREYNESLYQEGLSISRDLFNMQLDNIKSQPLIPSRVTTIDVKYLDGIYLEFYSTNDTELGSIEDYYKYNGNRIDDYGFFEEYWGHFVRGKIIKSNNYTQPEIDELNRRLSMGIFTEVKYGN